MLIGGVAFGLVVGLLAGGSLRNLGAVRFRWLPILFLAVALRFATEAALNRGVVLAEELRLPLLAASYGLLLTTLWTNRRNPGLNLAFIGIVGNATAITINGGRMPVWEPSLTAAGFTLADVGAAIHTVLPPTPDASFLVHAGPLGDIIPIPFPVVQNVASIGDVFLSAGLAFFLFASVMRRDHPDQAANQASGFIGIAGSARLPRSIDAAFGYSSVRSETGLAAGLAEASVLERPVILGGSGAGLASPALAPLPFESSAEVSGRGEETASAEGVGLPIFDQLRAHPYVQLALNGSFSALWTGQLISSFGDRIHQVALAFLVLGATNSPAAVGLVFLAATLPNLLLGPISGTFVDRWSQKQVMVVSDLLRASIVLAIPLAAVTNIALVYPLVFLVTSISIFFRPARESVVPRIVPPEQLLVANSATWVGENLADIAGYPLAGIFVAFLGTALPLAFWLDAVTYLASAALIATMAIPPLTRRTMQAGVTAGFRNEFLAGWRFLRGEAVLLANTLQAIVGQFTSGVLIALLPVYARDVLQRGPIDPSATYGLLYTSIGVGNLIGGFAIGLIGRRGGKGWLVVAGYAAMGVSIAGLALTGQILAAVGLLVADGIANMVYIIPSQTLFQQRTPADMIGRVVGLRFSLVFGSLTLAMGVSGVLAERFGVGPVLATFGIITAISGVAGLLVPAVRRA